MSIAANLEAIRGRMEAAAKRVHREPGAVALMAVCKTMPTEKIREANAAGQRLFGENRVQEFAEKKSSMTGLTDARFHLIGHLQSNKAAKAVELFHAVDSVDSLRLADRLDAAARKLGKRLPVLIEINIGGEAAKSGLSPDDVELEELLHDAPRLEALDMRGLMTIPPHSDDPEGARPYFQRMRALRDSIAKRKLPYVGMDELSMGMSHDFEVAIEEGSTCVRVGTAIFGERTAGAEQ